MACASGSSIVWSLADGYVDLPAKLLREPNDKISTQRGSYQPEEPLVRLSVNCFLIDRPGVDRVLIDCGAGGSWHPSMGHLEEAMSEAGVDTSSITMVALTHAHGDHINGLLKPDGRRAFRNLKKILIAEDAVEDFLAEPGLADFQPLLRSIREGTCVDDKLLTVALPGHAPGHMGFLLSTGEDNVLFCGDLIHVPAAQFTRPELTWAYDADEAVARASRTKMLDEAARERTWLAGAHLGRPGIGRIIRKGGGYVFSPVDQRRGEL